MSTLTYKDPTLGTVSVPYEKLLTHDDPLVGPPIVINTKGASDRMDAIAEHLEKWGIPIIRIPAVEALADLPACTLSRHQVNSNLSHAAASRYAAVFEDVRRPAWLVLEDDCRFLGDPREAVAWALGAAPQSWSIISLGCHAEDKPQLTGPSRHFGSTAGWEPMGNHSYLVSASGGMRLMAAMSMCLEPVGAILRKEMAAGRGLLVRPAATVQEEYISSSTGTRRPTMTHADIYVEPSRGPAVERWATRNTGSPVLRHGSR